MVQKQKDVEFEDVFILKKDKVWGYVKDVVRDNDSVDVEVGVKKWDLFEGQW